MGVTGVGGGAVSAPADRAVSITMLYMSCNLCNQDGAKEASPSVLTMVDLEEISVKGKQRKLGRLDRQCCRYDRTIGPDRFAGKRRSCDNPGYSG
jgi:hypothetical protein